MEQQVSELDEARRCMEQRMAELDEQNRLVEIALELRDIAKRKFQEAAAIVSGLSR